MNIEEIATGIVHAHFDTRRRLCSTFVRFQEHYESPEFKGKLFSLAEFKAWYVPNSFRGKRQGTYSYNYDWSGFNLPSRVLAPFLEGQFNPLRALEEQLLSALPTMDSPFYLIGTFGKNNDATLNHEIAHALYTMNPAYQAEAQQIVRRAHPTFVSSVHAFLTQRGYDQSVFDDEVHAYAGEETRYLTRPQVKIDITNLEPTASELRELFKQHTGRER